MTIYIVIAKFFKDGNINVESVWDSLDKAEFAIFKYESKNSKNSGYTYHVITRELNRLIKSSLEIN